MEERGGTTKTTMMSSTLMGATLFTIALGIPEGPSELEARKEAECRRKERMGNVPLSKYSGHRASETGIWGGFLTMALG